MKAAILVAQILLNKAYRKRFILGKVAIWIKGMNKIVKIMDLLKLPIKERIKAKIMKIVIKKD